MTRVLFVLVALGAAGCAADPDTSTSAQPAVPVQTAPASLERQAAEFESGGTVRARTTTVLSSRVMSAIAAVTVKPGDRVRAGQVLVRLDARQLDAGQARADAGLAAALEGALAGIPSIALSQVYSREGAGDEVAVSWDAADLWPVA